ncbi:hypothetical protein LJR130_003819 [Variovorax sp. LjRoot130]|uniref:hypothetical protein n=1 Tax=unclassified Variovorax TaxID=663243 RepID=UPI003ECFDD00
MSEGKPAERAIKVDQPAPGPRPQVSLYQWWKLPSGQVVELRRIAGQHNPEVTVRNVNENGEMAPGEYVLTLRFLVNHGQKVKG